jgi:alkanesulfonate monooxygenase SsuD/methylene tetrahydromethanopterin reductase-like flavin-dependent oxidoreductase (luciferase family)
LKADESGEPLHIQQRTQIERYREAWKAAGHDWEPRVSVSRSIIPLTTDEDRGYFGHERRSQDTVGQIEPNLRAVFGRTYAAEPDVLIEQLAEDEAIAAADTLLVTVPNLLGVDYNAHLLDTLITDVAPGLGWR